MTIVERLVERFLADVTAPERPNIAAPTTIVVAHPDDETLACGALLPRLTELKLVLVTDGAPRDGSDAALAGFPDWSAYGAARRRELEAAMAIAGIAGTRLVAFGAPDQGVAAALTEVSRRLVPLLADSDVVLTHAFEGGHPDHDGVAFAVQAAVALLRQRGKIVAIVEMPLYRAGADGSWMRQSFEDESGAAVLRLTPAERRTKDRMLAAYASQQGTLAGFSTDAEPYRAAAAHDFSRAPNRGRILYETQPWGMVGGRFAELAQAALHDLGLRSGA